MTPPGSTMAVINITDSPSDRVLSFEVTIESLSLLASDGSSVLILNTPRRLEVTHVSGSAEPLGITAFPQGTFTAVRVTVSNPDVTFIDGFGNSVEKKNVGSPTTLTIPFAQPLVVGSMPFVLTIDINAGGSIQIDPATDRVTVNTVAGALHKEIPGNGGENGEDPDNGKFEHFTGQVTGVSGNNFVVNARGTSITFTTDSRTKFNIAGGVGALPNTIVRVEAQTQQNGVPLAREVEVLSAAGGEIEGLVNVATGSPVSTFSVVVQDASGPSVSDALLGDFVTVNINPGTTSFQVDKEGIDLDGLELPVFGATSLSRGQSLEVDAVENSSGSVIVADSVKLQSQPLTGSISNASSSEFTLSLGPDSVFRLLNGAGTLKVLTQRNTQLKDNVTISNGATVKVRGLVFFDPNSNSFTMVAERISAAE